MEDYAEGFSEKQVSYGVEWRKLLSVLSALVNSSLDFRNPFSPALMRLDIAFFKC